ncbi:hypothetical protein [Amycolatopsis jejuensis]|uniref:hypothetical protein n=1 Tax=Amycolatopsis jejuensis TaxID=330084 RepID=UPI000AA3F2D9|nr:hypothetical protein [Amycolatopsis jejuensis]
MSASWFTQTTRSPVVGCVPVTDPDPDLAWSRLDRRQLVASFVEAALSAQQHARR